MITALDRQVGRLRDKLRELGIEKNTVLFYTSDNGPEGKSVTGRTQGITNGLTGRKRSLNEGGIRVPGIMEWDGKIGPGTKVDIPCFTSDYFPTIANILGVDLDKNKRPYGGVDILPIVKGEIKRRKEPLAFDFNEQAVLIDNDYKIYSDDGGQHFALYNIRNDIGENSDLANERPEKLNEMVAYWNQWKVSQEKSASGSDY